VNQSRNTLSAIFLLLATGCAVVVPAPVQDGKTPVCHKGKKTLYVGDSAVDAHLKHGDYVGECH
jgi:hypothetical protein